jgi:hypothetical protein
MLAIKIQNKLIIIKEKLFLELTEKFTLHKHMNILINNLKFMQILILPKIILILKQIQ